MRAKKQKKADLPMLNSYCAISIFLCPTPPTVPVAPPQWPLNITHNASGKQCRSDGSTYLPNFMLLGLAIIELLLTQNL